jgi:hypothetical protein
MSDIKAIETQYKGYKFRSRLEARWAVFFDALGIEWEYEHEGYDLGKLGWYLPDFWFPGFDCFGEVKATTFTELEFDRCDSLPSVCLILEGSPKSNAVFSTTGHDVEEGECRYCVYGNGNLPEVILTYSKYRRELCWLNFREDIKNYPSVEHAVTSARSARFEHGESVR